MIERFKDETLLKLLTEGPLSSGTCTCICI
jgi:hypothetical protein